jgi:uncharacterized repeat protein (TIGR01451 family)
VGSAYDFTYTVSGAPVPEVSLVSGALPPGLTLGTGGRLSGTPTKAGSFTFSVEARNAVGSARVTSSLIVSKRTASNTSDLRVDLSGPAVASKGKLFTYAVTTKNAGPSRAEAVHTKVILPPNVQFVSATGKYTRIGSVVIFQRAGLADGRSFTEKITVRAVTQKKGTALAATFSPRNPDPDLRRNTDSGVLTVK